MCAAHRAQGDHLLRQIDPVGHRLQPEITGDPQQPTGDLVQPRGLDDALDQTAVQFQYVDGEPPERGDRRVAAPEPVEGDPDAEPPERGQTALQLVQGDPRIGVGQLDQQRPRRQPVPGQQRLDRPQRHRPVQQPPRTHPHGHRHREPGRGPLGGLLHGLLQHPAPQLGGLVAVLGHPQELGRREQHPLRGAPARLGGHRRDPAVHQRHHGLVQQRELAVVQCGPQPRGQLRLPYDVLLHLRCVQLDAALARPLGAVHREVRVAQQLPSAQARFGEGDADGGRDADIVAVDEVRLGQGDSQPVGELHDVPLAGGAVPGAVADDQGRELVSAEPGRGVAVPDRGLEAVGGLDEQFVTGLVADGVVDGLEAVEVDEEHGRAAVGGTAAGQGLLDALGEQRAVGQVGERVVLGVVLQLRLEAHAFGHVPAVEDQAAVVAVDRRLDIEPASPALGSAGAGGARTAGPEAALDPGGGLLDGAGGEEAAHLVHHTAEVLRVDQRGQFGSDQLLGVLAVDTGGGRGDVAEDAVRGGDHDDVAGALHQGAEMVLLLRQFLGEGDVVEQHDALAHHEGEDHAARGDEHHAVGAAAVEHVVENPQRADGGGEIRGERAQRTRDGPGDRIAAGVADLLAARHGDLGDADPRSWPVLVHHARVPVVLRLGVPGRGPGGVGEEQRAGEPARVEQLARVVAVVEQRRGEQGVAHHRQGQRADRGVHRGAVDRGAAEVQREHHADERDVEQRVRQRQRGGGHARPVELGGLGQREAPGQREQRAPDQPGVERQTDPTGLRDRPLGEHQEPDDGGRREAQKEQVGETEAGHGLLEHDLVPPPDAVAQCRHRRGEREQQPGGSKADTAASRVEEARDGRGAGRRAEPEVAHDHGDLVRAPVERGTDGVSRADQGQDELLDQAARAAGSRRARLPRSRRSPVPERPVEGGRRRRWGTHRSLPVRVAPGSRGPRCAG